MNSQQVATYGSWKSPITSDLIVKETINLGAIIVDGEDVYWTEVRSQEGGRYVIVRRKPGGEIEDVLPAPYNARTRVHEYGGGAYTVYNGMIYFSNFSDQRIYRIEPGGEPIPVTPEGQYRYADLVYDSHHQRLICVREDHTNSEREAVNTIVSVELQRGKQHQGNILIEGNDFYSFPRLSPDGKSLAWTTWNHPNMPWDGTELWVTELSDKGSLVGSNIIAGGEKESIFQPTWSTKGSLTFVSDRSGWWNLYHWKERSIDAIKPMEAEFGLPQWLFGGSTYGFSSEDRIICAYKQEGQSFLSMCDLFSNEFEQIDTPFTDIWGLKVSQNLVYFMAGSPTEPMTIVCLDLNTGDFEAIRKSTNVNMDPGYLSIPQPIEFPTDNTQTAHAYFYPPKNKDYVALPGEKPPLLVMSHGGPTGSTSTILDLEVQYWTSRGIAVVDVNYGGSTGYGRAYRERLNGQWGVVDMQDCANAARYLVERGEVDANRLAITGGSAGGYTTLCALTFLDIFKAGASHFGIGDLEIFVHDTHKFESRYLERLVGPYPERSDLYQQRSPIQHIDRLAIPIIIFQGLEDKIVPPNQAEMMYAAVSDKGIPVAYLPFEGEQHGFRRAENIKRALDAELYFYAKIFGFELAEPVEPVKIDNL